jgi:hypothetical protein
MKAKFQNKIDYLMALEDIIKNKIINIIFMKANFLMDK